MSHLAKKRQIVSILNVFPFRTSVFQRSIESPRGGRQPSRAAAAAAKKGIEQKRNNCRPPAKAELAGKQGAAYSKHMPKKGAKELRAQRGDNGAVISHGGQKSLACSASAAKAEKESDTNRLCQYVENVYFKLSKGD